MRNLLTAAAIGALTFTPLAAHGQAAAPPAAPPPAVVQPAPPAPPPVAPAPAAAPQPAPVAQPVAPAPPPAAPPPVAAPPPAAVAQPVAPAPPPVAPPAAPPPAPAQQIWVAQPVQPYPPQPYPPPPPPPVYAQPAAPPPTAAPEPTGPEQTLGFQVRLGGADKDRFLFGSAFVATSGVFELGVAGDALVNVGGTAHHDGSGHHDDWCQTTPDGRCLQRVDAALTTFGGVVLRPRVAGTRLRLDLVGELGWQVSGVRERTEAAGNVSWSEAYASYPVYGVRAGVGLHVFRAAYFGIGGFVRQAFEKPACVTTTGGCTSIDATTTGLMVYGGADFGARP